MNTAKFAKTVTYTVSPADGTGFYRLSITVDNNAPITLQSVDILLLAGLGRIIAYNKMPYHKASKLCEMVIQGEIPMGVLPIEYLYPGPAYRVILSYGACNGLICAHYFTPEEAYNSTLIQQEIAEACEKFTCKYEYDKYLSAVVQGKAYTIGHYTILHGRITRVGNLRGYAVRKKEV